MQRSFDGCRRAAGVAAEGLALGELDKLDFQPTPLGRRPITPASHLAPCTIHACTSNRGICARARLRSRREPTVLEHRAFADRRPGVAATMPDGLGD
jgi:hypothetical protein